MIKFCQHSVERKSHCSEIATYINNSVYYCKLHKTENCKEYDQSEELNKIRKELTERIGTDLYSSYHKNKVPFRVKYIAKDNPTRLMCTDKIGKWVAVYYDQIIPLPGEDKNKKFQVRAKTV